MAILPDEVLRSIVLHTPGSVAYTDLGEAYWISYANTTLQAAVFEADQINEVMEQGALEPGDILIYLEDGQWVGINAAFPSRAYGFSWQGQTYRVIRSHRPYASWATYWKIIARRDVTLLGGRPPYTGYTNPQAYTGLTNLHLLLTEQFDADVTGAFADVRKGSSAPLFVVQMAGCEEVKNFGQKLGSGTGRVWEVTAEVWCRTGNQAMDSVRFLSAVADYLMGSRAGTIGGYSIRVMGCELTRVGATLNPDTPASSLKVVFQTEPGL